jgi:NAD(P)-dependent dehydrogenase (short-subunit alcohol dehydrogenase family)
MVRFCPMGYAQSPGDRLDVLVLNAGISKAALIADYTVEDFDNLFATKVRSPFFLVQQLIPTLGEGSNIIVISSAVARTVVGKPGLENRSILACASTKGAIETLVRNQYANRSEPNRKRLQMSARNNHPPWIEILAFLQQTGQCTHRARLQGDRAG